MRSEEEIARAALNARMKAERAQRGLTLAEQQIDRVVLFHAAIHALCFRAQFCGVTQEDLSSRLRGEEHAAPSSMAISDRLHAQLQQGLGLKRLDDKQRARVNTVLGRVIYPVIEDVPIEIALAILIRFIKRHAQGIGLPVDVVVERVVNLDALQRFAGPPVRYIPQEQYGL